MAQPCEQERYVRCAPQILRAVLVTESKVAVESVSKIVSIETCGVETFAPQEFDERI